MNSDDRDHDRNLWRSFATLNYIKCMHIRQFTASDTERVVALFRESVLQYFAPEEEQELLTYLRQPPQNYFVLEDGGELVACGGIKFDELNRSCRVAWDFVGARQYGKGYGSKLLSHRIELVRRQKLDRMQSYTSQFSYGFYQKHGFEMVRTERDYWAKGYDLVLMELDLRR